MPIYENRRNAENLVRIAPEALSQVRHGFDAGLDALAEAVRTKNACCLLLDGWYGIDWKTIVPALQSRLNNAKALSCASIYYDAAKLAELKTEWITEDPCFGKVNNVGTLDDFIDSARLKAFEASCPDEFCIVYGPGALKCFPDCKDSVRCYFDMTADPMLWQMWNGELIPFGSTEPRKDYGWKEYYYNDFYVLQRHKAAELGKCDFYCEAVETKELTLMPEKVFEEILAVLARQPMKQIRTYSPGPWGAYRYRQLWDIPGLENNAWNRLAGADLSLLIELENGVKINIPSVDLLIDNAAVFVGEFPAREYPGLIPVEIWLDDGYFPDKQPAERTSMPIHNHPGTEYVKRHFNEPLGRYETYYIVEAYPGANTWMGFNNDACTEEWDTQCRKSWKEQKAIPNWKEYIANWQTNVGDLFLIPEGTTHGHGGYQMVLEMDTCGNAAGGEYSFFGYDFMRPTWDDRKKTMTGKPMKMHLERYFEIDKGFRADWVQKNLRARPVVIEWNQEYSRDRYTTLPQMPFEIERTHFTKRADGTTEGKYLQAATLTVGTSVVIRSKAHPERCCRIERLQCALIPAGFGDYEIINEDEGASTVVMWRLKQA